MILSMVLWPQAWLIYLAVGKLYFKYQQHISLKRNILRTFVQFSLWHTCVWLHRKATRLYAICCVSDAKQFWKRRFLTRQGKNLQIYWRISRIFNEVEAKIYLSKPYGLLAIKVYYRADDETEGPFTVIPKSFRDVTNLKLQVWLFYMVYGV